MDNGQWTMGPEERTMDTKCVKEEEETEDCGKRARYQPSHLDYEEDKEK